MIHTHRPIMEETHYYPFGLMMAGMSSRAAGSLINKRGYNSNELQTKEFSDGSGLEVYDFNARTYDQQIGRFIQIDPLVEFGQQEMLTSYQFSYNNPIRYNDPDGKFPIAPLIPWIARGIYAAGSAIVSYYAAKAAAPIIEQAAQDAGKALSQAPPSNIVMGGPLLMGTASYTPKSNTNTNNTESKKFDGQNSTENTSSKEALRNAKDQNGIPRSQQPDKTIKPNTPEGNNDGLDNRNVKQFEYTNSKGEKVVIRQDKPAEYKQGPPQGPHFNAGKNPEVPKDLNQHHNYKFDFKIRF